MGGWVWVCVWVKMGVMLSAYSHYYWEWLPPLDNFPPMVLQPLTDVLPVAELL